MAVAQLEPLGVATHFMNATSHPAGSRRAVSGLLLVVVFVTHCLVGFMLYRGRVVSRWPISDSDFVVFAVPFFVALLAYAYVLLFSPWLRPRSVLRYIGLSAACLLLVFLSTWCYMFFALNTYGS